MLSGLIKPAPCLIEMLDRMNIMNFSEYAARIEAAAATGATFRAVDGDIVDMLSASYQIQGDIVDGVLAWAKTAGVVQYSQEWADTADSARFVRKYRMAEQIKVLQDELALLEAQESGND